MSDRSAPDADAQLGCTGVHRYRYLSVR